MKNLIIEKLESEVLRLVDELATLETESKEYNDTIKTINSLYDTLNKEKELMLSEYKVDVEAKRVDNDKLAKDTEADIQRETLKDSKLWNGVKTGVEIGAIVLPLASFALHFREGLKFEETGTITSGFVRGLVNKMKFTK